jgi:hypothetical protein
MNIFQALKAYLFDPILFALSSMPDFASNFQKDHFQD